MASRMVLFSPVSKTKKSPSFQGRNVKLRSLTLCPPNPTCRLHQEVCIWISVRQTQPLQTKCEYLKLASLMWRTPPFQRQPLKPPVFSPRRAAGDCSRIIISIKAATILEEEATRFVSCGAPQGIISSSPQLPPVPAQPILSRLTVLRSEC